METYNETLYKSGNVANIFDYGEVYFL